MPAKAGTQKFERSGHNTKQSHMKQISQSIIKSTKSLPGRWAKVTTVGCILALVFLGATSAQPKASGTERPFKVTGIFTMDADAGTFKTVGNATHLGNFVFPGGFSAVGFEENDVGYLVTLHIQGAYTAANGDTIEVDCSEWVTQYLPDGSPVWSTGTVEIIGGTGRFANASGSYVGNIYPVGVTFILIGEGTISY
jgi:hypothetical protein